MSWQPQSGFDAAFHLQKIKPKTWAYLKMLHFFWNLTFFFATTLELQYIQEMQICFKM